MRFRNGLVLAIAVTLLIPCALQAEEKKTETTRNSNSVVTKKNTNTTNQATTQPQTEEEKNAQPVVHWSIISTIQGLAPQLFVHSIQ